MKRLLSLIMAVILVATMSIGAEMLVSADAAPQVVLSSAKAVAGSTADITVSVKNNPGIAALKVTVAYSEDLSVPDTGVVFNSDVTRTAEVSGGAVDTAEKFIDNDNGEVTLNWFSSSTNNYAEDFVLATITFAIAEDATLGDTDITVTADPADIIDIDEQEVAFQMVGGKITVVCGHTDTETRDAKAATCTEAGYTGDTYCLDCGEKIADGEAVKALGHTGGTATCCKKAVCTRCKKEYGDLNAKNHTGGTEVKGKKAATEEAQGYTGDTYCKGCGAKLSTGKSIPALVVTYKITYKLDGGTNAKNPTTYTYATSTITLKNPTKKGYTFKGWYNGSKKVTEIKKGSKGNITLTAKWAVITYKITYKLNSGKNNAKNPASYKITSSDITLKAPTRKGYKFGGWYSDSKFTKKVTKIAKGSTGNKTLYAKWTVITYKITYKLAGGKNNSKNPKSYKVTTSTITLKAATRKGYTFKGWYNGSKKVTKIAKGSTGNMTLTAKWAKKK